MKENEREITISKIEYDVLQQAKRKKNMYEAMLEACAERSEFMDCGFTFDDSRIVETLEVIAPEIFLELKTQFKKNREEEVE